MRRILLIAAALLAVSAGVASADTPVTVGSGWHGFVAHGPGVPSASPFTFISTAPVLVTVTDVFCLGDQYTISDGATTLGTTSAPLPFNCNYPNFTANPDTALADPNYSHGRFAVGAGAHSIGIIWFGQFGSGSGVFYRFDLLVAANCASGGWQTITASPAFTSEADCLAFVSADTTAPTITVPAPITTNATSPTGTPVSYTVTSTDPDDAVASLSCLPASGGTFAIGTATVTCTATDTHGNAAHAQFSVHVNGAGEELSDLAGAVAGVGPGGSLATKIAQAQSALGGSDFVSACSSLGAFVNEVSSQTGKGISADQAAAVLAQANRIRAVLACGGAILFTRAGDVWVMHADGSSPTQLTTDPAFDRAPSWSPDGNKIAFASARTGNFEIWVMDANGGNQHQITHDAPNNDRSPSWPADGSQLVYDVNFNAVNVINVDGTGEHQLRVNAAVPNVSPQNVIAFTDQVDGGVYTMNLAGGGLQFVSNPLGQGTLDPDWSPSGDRLAFICDVVASPTNNLCVTRSDGTGLVSLDTSPDRVDFSPTWSPDGNTVAFVGCVNFFATPDCEIYTVSPDGAQLTKLTSFGVGAGARGIDWGRG